MVIEKEKNGSVTNKRTSDKGRRNYWSLESFKISSFMAVEVEIYGMMMKG